MSVQIYSAGIFCASVCAPASMSIEDVCAAANAQELANLSEHLGAERAAQLPPPAWQLCTEEKFKGGQPNPCPCEIDGARRHWLLER